MVLIDTSVWIDFLRYNDDQLAQLLEFGQVMTHPYIVTELALGSLQNRKEFLTNLQNLPQATIYQRDINSFIDDNKLYSLGIGFVDVHLLASCQSMNIKLWTRDKRLSAIAKNFGFAYTDLQ